MLQNSQKFRVLWHGRTELTEVPGGVKTWCTRTPDIVHGAYRTHTRSGYGYKCHTGLTEFPGTGVKVLQNFHKFRELWNGRTDLTELPGRYKNAVLVPRELRRRRTDLTEVPGTGINVVQNSQILEVLCTGADVVQN